MPISSIFQGNSEASSQTSQPSGSQTVSQYIDETDSRTNFPIPNLKLNSLLKGFSAIVTVSVDAQTDLSETFQLLGTNDGTDWSMAQTSVNNVDGESKVSFSIDNTGQIYYSVSSTSITFVKRTINWNIIAL